MLFNSFPFAVFFVVVFAAYWSAGHRSQNYLLLAASWFFYGYWSVKFLGLLVLSTVVDYACGLALERLEGRGARRAVLVTSLVTQLGLLAAFKYSNFFLQDAGQLLDALGLHVSLPVLSIVLPVGISFYTFQSLSYTIDVYRRRMAATRNWVDFALFVSFFPQLVAGPIERAKNLLPQVQKPRRFSYEQARDGIRLVLWGLFIKVVVADNLAPHVDAIFAAPQRSSASELLLAVYFFAVQIYCDFNGYSTMARGLGKLLGFEMMVNFRTPYFAESIPEFWSRWHISLSTWFRDYLYIPLGGSRVRRARHYANLVIVFLVSGLWHGANWTFVLWGALHACFHVTTVALGRRRGRAARAGGGGLGRLARLALTFHLVCLGWVFFRAASFAAALGMLAAVPAKLVAGDLAVPPSRLFPLALVVGLLVAEWLWHERPRVYAAFLARPWLRYAAYEALGLAVLGLGNFSGRPFIYFQF